MPETNHKKFSEFPLSELGSTIRSVGSVYANSKEAFLLWFPNEEPDGRDCSSVVMSPEDWEKFLRQSDFVETEVLRQAKDGSVVKVMLRKNERTINRQTQWRVFKRAGFRCEYCGSEDKFLTVDHLVTWEVGGPSIDDNLAASCSDCNHTRGKLDYDLWLGSDDYKHASRNLSAKQRELNLARAVTLGNIPRLIHIKSRG